METNLYTIKKFAEIVGVKPQGIYKQATNKNSRLYSYVVQIKGKRFIKEEALKDIYQIEPPEKTNDETNSTEKINQFNQNNQLNQPIQPENSNDETDQPNRPAPNPYEEVITILRQELEEKRQEVKEKDRIIEEMRVSAEKEREHLRILLDQEQHLHAQTKLRLKEYEEETRQDVEEEQPREERDTSQEQKKRGWLYNLFRGISN